MEFSILNSSNLKQIVMLISPVNFENEFLIVFGHNLIESIGRVSIFNFATKELI